MRCQQFVIADAEGGEPAAVGRIERHDEGARAQQRLCPQHLETAGIGVDEGLQFFLIVAAEATQPALGVVVGDDVADGARALGLEDQPALELQRGADDDRQHAGFAQEGGDDVGIVVGVQDVVERLAQPHQTPMHRMGFNDETRRIVFGRRQGRRNRFGHEGSSKDSETRYRIYGFAFATPHMEQYLEN